MKRRSFLKGILGISVLPLIPVQATPLAPVDKATRHTFSWPDHKAKYSHVEYGQSFVVSKDNVWYQDATSKMVSKIAEDMRVSKERVAANVLGGLK